MSLLILDVLATLQSFQSAFSDAQAQFETLAQKEPKICNASFVPSELQK